MSKDIITAKTEVQDEEVLEFIYTPTSFEFINDWDNEAVILGGPMNTGKGASSAMKMFQYMFERAPLVNGYRTSIFLGVRHDYSAYRDTTLTEIYKWFPPGCVYPPKGKVNTQTTEIRIKVPQSGTNYGVDAKIIMVSMKNFNPDDIRSYNVTGLQWSELQECEDPDLFGTLLDRTGRYPYRDMPKLFFGDINYPDDMHWLYKRFVEDKEHTNTKLRWKLYRQPAMIDLNENNEYVENPLAEIPSHKRNYDYWWSIVHRAGAGEIRRSVIGDFAIQPIGEPVYPSFKDDMIICAKPIRGKTLLFGIDPGHRNHLAVVIAQLDLKGKLRILASLSPEEHMDFGTFSDEILLPYIMSELYPVLCPNGGKIKTFGWRDPTDAEDKHNNKNTGDMIKELTGINTVRCSTNSVNLRILATSTRIRGDLLEVDEGAKMLVKALKGGYYIDKKGKPDKGAYSHVGNALEYLCYGISSHLGDFDDSQKPRRREIMST